MTNWIEIGAIGTVASITITIFGWIGRGIWKIVETFDGMRMSLHTIATNDLPHIYQEIKSLREDYSNGQDQSRNKSLSQVPYTPTIKR